MDEFGEEVLGHRSQLQEALALEIEAAPRARDRGQVTGSQISWIAEAALGEAGMARLVTARGDTRPIWVQMKRGGEANRLRWHGVSDPLVGDHARRPYQDLELERVVCGRDGYRTQPLLILQQQHAGDLTCGPTRPLLVDLGEPLLELNEQVFPVLEPADLEEAVFDPADQILDRALLVGSPRRTEFDPEAEVVRNYGVYNLLRDGYATPSTFIIDKNGNVRWKYIGQRYNDRPTNQQIIAQLRQIQTP